MVRMDHFERRTPRAWASGRVALPDGILIDGVLGHPNRPVAAAATGRGPDFAGAAIMFDQAAFAGHAGGEAPVLFDNADLIFEIGQAIVCAHGFSCHASGAALSSTKRKRLGVFSMAKVSALCS